MIEIMWFVVSGKYCLQLRTPIWRPSATVIQLQSPKLRHLFNVYLLWVQILSSTYILCETRQSLHVQMSTALKTQSSTTSSYWVLQDVDKGGARLQSDQCGESPGPFSGNDEKCSPNDFPSSQPGIEINYSSFQPTETRYIILAGRLLSLTRVWPSE